MCEFWEMLEMDKLERDEESKKKKGCQGCSGEGFRLYCLVMCYELFVVDYFYYLSLVHSVGDTIIKVSSCTLFQVPPRQNLNPMFLLSFYSTFSTPILFSFTLGKSTTLQTSLLSMPFRRVLYSLSNFLIQFYILSFGGTSILVSNRSYFYFWKGVFFPFSYFIPMRRYTFSCTILSVWWDGARQRAQLIWLSASMVFPACILRMHFRSRASLLLKQYSIAFQTESKFSSCSALSRCATERPQQRFLKAEGRSPVRRWSANRLQQAWWLSRSREMTLRRSDYDFLGWLVVSSRSALVRRIGDYWERGGSRFFFRDYSAIWGGF